MTEKPEGIGALAAKEAGTIACLLKMFLPAKHQWGLEAPATTREELTNKKGVLVPPT